MSLTAMKTAFRMPVYVMVRIPHFTSTSSPEDKKRFKRNVNATINRIGFNPLTMNFKLIFDTFIQRYAKTAIIAKHKNPFDTKMEAINIKVNSIFVRGSSLWMKESPGKY